LGVLYVVSAEEAAGKTAVCAGLGRHLKGEGKKVGFLKPVSAEKSNADGDATFMKQVLDLPESAESLRPPVGDVKKIKEAYDKVTKGKDVIIVEGMLGQNADDTTSLASYEIAKALTAKVLAVEAYSEQASRYIDVYKGFGERLLGVVLNKVPESQLKRVSDETSTQFGAAGINVLGVLPENRVLFAITVGELADSIQGKILNNAEKSVELVENFMLGAMVVDSGLDYFGRKNNKAAVVRQDRPDMQLAALETSTRCLILSGSNQPPIYSVLQKAESKGIPIISTENTTDDIVTSIEDALNKGRFNQEKKLTKMAEIVKQHLDIQAVL
jgi:BioD-like phosphotransacetylase family protein